MKTITGLQKSLSAKTDKKNDKKDDDNEIRRCFTTLRLVMDATVKILAGGNEEAEELKSLYLSEEYQGCVNTKFIENSRKILSKTNKSSDAHRILQSVFTKSMGENSALSNRLGSRRSLQRSCRDFKNIVAHGMVESPKKLPRGKYVNNDDVISKVIDVIISLCSTTSWSMRCYEIREEKIVLKRKSCCKEKNENVGTIYLPVLHRRVSRA